MTEKKIDRPWPDWLNRIRSGFPTNAQDWWIDYVVSKINFTVPVVGPDGKTQYSLAKYHFLTKWVDVLVSLCDLYLTLQHEYPTGKNDAGEEMWWPHKSFFCDEKDERSRNFYKMRYLGLIRKPPAGMIFPEQRHPRDPKKLLKGSSGRFQPTEFAFAFLAGKLKVPAETTVFSDNLIGLSGPMLSVYRVVFEHQGFDWSVLREPPKGEANPHCRECGLRKAPYYGNANGSAVCADCLKPSVKYLYNKAVKPIAPKLVQVRKAGQYSKAWNNHYMHLYEPHHVHSRIEVEVNPEMFKSRGGAIQPSPDEIVRMILQRNPGLAKRLPGGDTDG